MDCNCCVGKIFNGSSDGITEGSGGTVEGVMDGKVEGSSTGSEDSVAVLLNVDGFDATGNSVVMIGTLMNTGDRAGNTVGRRDVSTDGTSEASTGRFVVNR